MTASFEIDGLSANARGQLISHRPWTLCLGAGINGKLVPTWQELARRLYRRYFGNPISDADFAKLVEGSRWSLDSWIQTALNKCISAGGSEAEFSSAVGSAIYADLFEKAKKEGVLAELRQGLRASQRLRLDEYRRLLGFMAESFGRTSLVGLANMFVYEIPSERRPAAVLNFNADTLFETVTQLILKTHFIETTGNKGNPEKIFRRVKNLNVDNRDGKVPLFHVHGYVEPVESPDNGGMALRRRLIFPESAYSGLAAQVFSWEQHLFLHYAQTSHMLFIGMSMSDPNVRRWLAWVERTRREALHDERVADNQISGVHYWITTRPDSKIHEEAYTYALRHLGIKLCWIPEWGSAATCLLNLLGLETEVASIAPKQKSGSLRSSHPPAIAR